MKTSQNSSLIIAGILLLFAFGRQLLSKLSPAEKTSSSLPSVVSTITDGLTTKGYSKRMADNWFLISKMETAAFTSLLFREFNNAFGMKQPKKRDTLSVGPYNGTWATFSSLSDSVNDLVLYMKEFNYPTDFVSLEEQIKFMKDKGYFQESADHYFNLVKAWQFK